MNESFSVRLNLLDGQVVDRERLPIGRVDDLELRENADGTVEIVAILTGSEALGERLGGRVGRWMSSVSARLRPARSPSGPTSIPVSLIGELQPLIKLVATMDELPEVGGLERWLASHFVERLPGTGDASE